MWTTGVIARSDAWWREPLPAAGSVARRDFAYRGRRRREIIAEPTAQQLPDAGVALAEHEMIGIADQMQLARLARAFEHLDRLFRGRDRIVGGMQQEERPRCDLADDFV